MRQNQQYGYELDRELRELAIDAKKIERLSVAAKAPAQPSDVVPESKEFKEVAAQQVVVTAVAQRSIIEGSELTNRGSKPKPAEISDVAPILIARAIFVHRDEEHHLARDADTRSGE